MIPNDVNITLYLFVCFFRGKYIMEDLENKSKKELVDLGKVLQIKNYSKLSKNQLVKYIKEHYNKEAKAKAEVKVEVKSQPEIKAEVKVEVTKPVEHQQSIFEIQEVEEVKTELPVLVKEVKTDIVEVKEEPKAIVKKDENLVTAITEVSTQKVVQESPKAQNKDEFLSYEGYSYRTFDKYSYDVM
jgi:hypothetical protein